MRQAILVLGMHRSGTSAVAGSLILQGASGPHTQIGANDSNPRGHFESSPIARMNDRLLSRMGSAWYDWRRLDGSLATPEVMAEFQAEAADTLQAEFGDATTIVLKDPRICRLMPYWRTALATAGFAPVVLMPVRHPLEVAASLHRRNGFSIEMGVWLWLRHVLDAERQTRDLPRFLFTWDSYLKDWRHTTAVARKTLQLDLPGEDNGQAIDAFLDSGLAQARPPGDAPAANPQLRQWMNETVESLEVLTNKDNAGTARECLDSITSGVDAALAPLHAAIGGLVAECGNQAQKAQSYRAELFQACELVNKYRDQAKTATSLYGLVKTELHALKSV